jgi:hypothetical protein
MLQDSVFASSLPDVCDFLWHPALFAALGRFGSLKVLLDSPNSMYSMSPLAQIFQSFQTVYLLGSALIETYLLLW